MRLRKSRMLVFVVLSAIIVIGILNYPRFVISLVFSLTGVVILLIVADVIKERYRGKKEGYRVYTRGGAEDGSVSYDEGGGLLELYFDRVKNTIYVPSDAEWKQIMPAWARDRKDEIMGRIKQHVGKRWIGDDWNYEETDKEELLMNQRR